MRWLAFASLLVGVQLAHANGRGVQTVSIHPQPGDPNTLYLATTFGLLVSHDEGCTFHWMCEQSVGYGGVWDPNYAIGSDGTIFATTFDGLRVSRDGGCTFTTATSELAPNDPTRIADIWIDALDIGPTGEIWVGTAETGHTNDVFVSLDNGVSFQSRGMLSPEIWWKSVKIAPSNPAHVYITGYQVAGTPVAYFYRTTNGGMMWTPSPLANVMYASTPVLRVKAVDAIDPNLVYMVSEGANPPTGDRLYRSTDGGTTFAEVLATPASIHDVVIRDAQRVMVVTQVKGTSSVMGGPAFESSDGGLTFSQLLSAPLLACLAKRDSDGVLFGCGANWEPDFKAVARSNDGVNWEKVWRFVEIAGAVKCAEGTVQHDTCDVSLWDCPACQTDLKRQFGAKGPACGPVMPDAFEPPPKKGCCDGSGGAQAGVLWLLVLVWFMRGARASSGSAARRRAALSFAGSRSADPL